ncbi:MAG: C69 family dipeptidase [Candidatus Thermoplasmatota archaeon]|nr:C69 family dipeptidase [Candidatus Thermoplasmatota archaeon]
MNSRFAALFAVVLSLTFLLLAVAPISSACDTFVAMGDVTANGHVIFGKNSDRPAFDCQPLLYHSRAEWPAGSTLKLEYIEIPQANVTYATIGCSPYWCYGYEMGVSEWGVVAGNEAIWTTTLAVSKQMPPERGFVGMDLLRIGLERSKTAHECLQVITSLLEQYGQWGSAEPKAADTDGSYDNSFIIADSTEAWILETAGKDWIAKRITAGTDSISNAPSLLSDWTEGTLPAGTPFMAVYSDNTQPATLSGRSRELRSQMLLDQYAQDGIELRDMMAIARDHNVSVPGICMHQIPALNEDITAGSLMVVLPKQPGEPIEMWWTPVQPCSGIYVPLLFESGKPPEVMSKTGSQGKTVTAPSAVQADTFNKSSYWWLFKSVCDLGLDAATRASFDNVEIQFESEMAAVKANPETAPAFTEKCTDTALSTILSAKLQGTDTEKPQVYGVSAKKGADGKTALSANFSDDIKVEISSVKIFVEGNDVTNQSEISSTGFRYVADLPKTFDLRIELNDVAGNSAIFEQKAKAQSAGAVPGFESALLILAVCIFFISARLRK